MANGARRRALRAAASSRWSKAAGAVTVAMVALYALLSSGEGFSNSFGSGAVAFQRALGDFYTSTNRLRALDGIVGGGPLASNGTDEAVSESHDDSHDHNPFEPKAQEEHPVAEPEPSASGTSIPAPIIASSVPSPAPVNVGSVIHIDTIPSPGRDRAIVTLATGDEAARMALALVQSLRDVGTDPHVDIVVLLFPGGVASQECFQGDWRRAHGRENVRCGGDDAVAEEIINPHYVASFRRLGCKVVVMPPIPRYDSTRDIPGGTSSFW